MKKILILIFVSLAAIPMEPELSQEKVKEHKNLRRDYALINSFLDAYLAPNFYKIGPDGVIFAHYEDDPQKDAARRYSLTFEQGAKILYRMQIKCRKLGQLAQDKLIALSKDLQAAKDASEKDKNILALFPLQNFCTFLDIKWASDAVEVSAQRLIYQAAWATHDSTKVIEALKYDYKLHSKKVPYVFLRQQINDLKNAEKNAALEEIQEDRARLEELEQRQKAANSAIKGKK